MNQIVDPGKMNRTAQQFTQAQMQFSIAGDMSETKKRLALKQTLTDSFVC